jgi:hypothetical protein
MKEITGNKKYDENIKLIGIIGIGIGGFFLFKALKDRFQTPVNTAPIQQPPGCNVPATTQMIIKNQMDKIYSLLNGWNVYNYPAEVNVILGYSKCEAELANLYMFTTYGTTLFKLINAEWDLDGDYTAALQKLKGYGLAF